MNAFTQFSAGVIEHRSDQPQTGRAGANPLKECPASGSHAAHYNPARASRPFRRLHLSHDFKGNGLLGHAVTISLFEVNIIVSNYRG
jgi:hypothetical protein